MSPRPGQSRLSVEGASPPDAETAHRDVGSDEDLLDRYFDDAVSALQEGAEMPLPGAAASQHLAPQVERLADLARFVAPSLADEWPRIAGYTILSELGRGGMASVYLARQERLGGRAVALKVLPRRTSLSPLSRERFRAEVLAIARQKHPGIVPVYDVVDDGSTLAFAMQWVDGLTLEQVVARLAYEFGGKIATARDDRQAVGIVGSAIDPRDAGPPCVLADPSWSALVARIGVTCGGALHSVHQSGLLHRDVKPSNILIRRDGTVLLSDFGLARDLGGEGMTVGEPFLGTAPYAPPEQLQGARDEMDARSDVYSLGAALYHALALAAPFKSSSPVAVLKAVETSGAPPLRGLAPGVAADLQVIIAKAMDPDPARRYRSAEALADDLKRFLEVRPIKARPISLAARAWKFARRNRSPVITALLVAMIAASVAGVGVTRVFYYPRWAGDALNEARGKLLTRELGYQMYNHAYHGVKAAVAWPTLETWEGRTAPPLQALQRSPAERLQAALAEYQRSLAFNPDDAAVRVEHDVVRAILELSRPGVAPEAITLAGCPLATAYLHRARLQEALPARDDIRRDGRVFLPDAAAATPMDLRAAGVAALLLQDATVAIEALSELERFEPDDPFVAATLGMLYVCEERYPLAYPRLWNAVRAYPLSGLLHQFTAEAAWGCGDLAKARRHLEASRGLPEEDEYALYRLDMLCRVREIGIDAVVAQFIADYDGPLGDGNGPRSGVATNGILKYQLGRELDAAGRIELAIYFYSDSPPFSLQNTGGPIRWIVPAAQRWWAGLDDEARRERLRAALRGGSGWWGRVAPRPFVLFARCSDLEPAGGPDMTEAAAHLQAVSHRLYRDKEPEGFGSITGLSREQEDAVVEWWMTGKERPACLGR